MGGLISILHTAAHPETVAGIVLIDPALPVGLASRPDPRVAGMFGLYAVPAVGRTVVARRRSSGSAEELALSLLRLCCADPSRVPRAIVEQHLELARERNDYPDVDAELIVAARSLLWVLARRRLLASMLYDVTVPVLLLHGDRQAGPHRLRARRSGGQPDMVFRGGNRGGSRASARGADVDAQPDPWLAEDRRVGRRLRRKSRASAHLTWPANAGLPHQRDQLFGGGLDAVAQHLQVGNGVEVTGHPAGEAPGV